MSSSSPLGAVVDLETGPAGPDRRTVRTTIWAPTWLGARAASQGQLCRPPRLKAERVIKRRFHYEHGISSPIETRGVVAQWDRRANQMTVWDTTQAPVFIRNGLAAMLDLNERQVRVIAPFVGGGFGPKIMMFYPGGSAAARGYP